MPSIVNYGTTTYATGSAGWPGYTGLALKDPSGRSTYNTYRTGRTHLLRIYLGVGASFIVKLFRDDGTNYVFLGNLLTTSGGVGWNTIALPSVMMPINSFIGIYFINADVAGVGSVPDGVAYRYEDVTTTYPKSSWSHGASSLPCNWDVRYIGNIVHPF